MTAEPHKATIGEVFENRFGRYSVPKTLKYRPAAKAICDGSVYEEQSLNYMRENVGIGDIIHAGTFFGDFLPALSSGLVEGCRVWAFEPNPWSFQHAMETLDLNGLENVELRNAALSDRQGSLLFRTHQPDGLALGGQSSVVHSEEPGVHKVSAVMLDYAVPPDRHVSLIQLDVEGHEKQAILGAFHILHRCRPMLVLEDFSDLGWLNTQFPDHDFVLLGYADGNGIYVPRGHRLHPG